MKCFIGLRHIAQYPIFLPMQSNWYLRNVRVVDPATGCDRKEDILIAGGERIPAKRFHPETSQTLDADGLVAIPAPIDMHVHLREPGGEAAETLASGARAAARGGIATVVAMPNTSPPIDTPARLAAMLQQAKTCRYARILAAAALTLNRKGTILTAMEALADAGAVTFTDDGNCLEDDRLMEEALRRARRLARPVLDHALRNQAAAEGVMHQGEVSAQMGLPGIPVAAELDIVRRDLECAAKTGGHLHLQHLTAGDAVALLAAAREDGVPVSAEATPHHLWFCDEDIPNGNTNFKMNPPLRSREDRRRLLKGVVDGTITVLATDHAPHTATDKNRGWLEAPFGVTGLETALAATYTRLVKSGRLSLMEWVRRWTEGPAAVLGVAIPSISPGRPADLTLLDLNEDWTVQPQEFCSRSSNSPFSGMTLTGRVVATFCSGVCIWPNPNRGPLTNAAILSR